MKKVLYISLFILFISLIGIYISFNNANADSCTFPYTYDCINPISPRITKLDVDYNNKKITVSGKMPYSSGIPAKSVNLTITLLDSTGGTKLATLFSDTINSMQGDNTSFTKTIDFNTSNLNLNNAEYTIKAEAEFSYLSSYLEQKIILINGNIYDPSSDEVVEITTTTGTPEHPLHGDLSTGQCKPIKAGPNCDYNFINDNCDYTLTCTDEIPLHKFSNSTSTPDSDIEIVTNTSETSYNNTNKYTASVYNTVNPIINLFGGNKNLLRGSINPYILFKSNNADSCTITIKENTDAIKSNSRTYTYKNVVSGQIPQSIDFGGILSKGNYGSITADIKCTNLNSTSTSEDTATTNIFQDSILWKAKIKNKCSDDNNFAKDITDTDNVTFNYKIRQKDIPIVPQNPFIKTTHPMNLFVYGEPSIYVSLDGSSTPTYIPNNELEYEYCGMSGKGLDKDNNFSINDYKNSNTTNTRNANNNQQNDYTTPKSAEIDLYFAPKGQGPSPTPTSINGIGECHQNYPSADNQAQVYISWNPSENAVSYNVYKKYNTLLGSSYKLLGNTTNTYYIDYGNLEYGKEYTYAISSVDSGGKESDKSSDIIVETPSTCTIPNPQGQETLVIDPYESTINAGDKKQLNSLYDPDGTGTRYGNFLVNNESTWTIKNNTILQDLKNGLFKGLKSGSSEITSSYNGLTANAFITVVNKNNPDFSISIQPSVQTVDISSIQNTLNQTKNVNYTITITPLNEYTGNISLSIDGVPDKVDKEFNNNSISINSSENTAVLTLKVHPFAKTGISTFKVTGTDSNGISKIDTADINIINKPAPEPTISASIFANPVYIYQGDSSTLSWYSTSAVSCSIDNGIGDVSTSGIKEVYPNNIGINKYTLTCVDKNGNTASDYANVVVQEKQENNISCNISANPTAIIPGESSTLSWSCSNSTINTKCEIDNNIGNVNSSGSIKVKPKKTTNYTLNCYDGKESSSDSALVRVGFLPVIREIIPR